MNGWLRNHRDAVRGVLEFDEPLDDHETAMVQQDLTDLADTYSATHIEPFDLMPGTGHVETLVVMDQR